MAGDVLAGAAPGERVTGMRTDDLGGYRIVGLPPGRYFVTAVVGRVLITDPTADLPGYAQSYYPGTANAAERMSLGWARD